MIRKYYIRAVIQISVLITSAVVFFSFFSFFSFPETKMTLMADRSYKSFSPEQHFKYYQPVSRDSLLAYFHRAYRQYPHLPEGILEAISYNTTRLTHIVPHRGQSCMKSPGIYGVMGLSGGGIRLNNTLQTASDISGYDIRRIMNDPQINIFATAAWLDESFVRNRGDIAAVIYEYLGFTDNSEVADFLKKDFLRLIIRTMNKGVQSGQYIFSRPNLSYRVDEMFDRGFLDIYRKNKIQINYGKNTNSQDYPGAVWYGTDCYGSRNGTPITDVVIHDMEGYFSYTVYSHFQNCDNEVSAHYCIRSSDGFLVQLVHEADKAWHVGPGNAYSIGIEHEGFGSSSEWYTDVMYHVSADLVRDITQSGYGISPTSCYHGPSNQIGEIDPQPDYIHIKGHCHYAFSTHWDPGPYWDWYYYYDLINQTTHPDLVIMDMWTVPEMPAAGQPVDLYVTVKNIGDGQADNLSWDYKVNNATVGTGTYVSLEPGESHTAHLSGYSFNNAGSYNYCVYFDAVENEDYTINNSYCIEVNVSEYMGDVYISGVNVNPDNLTPGSNFSVSSQIHYSGNLTADEMPEIETRYYLSSDCQFDTDDVLLGSDLSDIGADNPYDTVSENLSLPGDLSSGTYYILFYTDYTDVITESNEDNNTACVEITVENLSTSRPSYTGQTLLYPNPVGNLLCFNTENSPIRIEIYDESAHKILQITPHSGGVYQADVSRLPEGIYFLHIVYNQGKPEHLKFIKK